MKTTKTETKDCGDVHCSTHGTVSMRGRVLEGTITAARMSRTATFHMERRHFIPKYQRYEKRKTVLKAHNPPCIAAVAGDKVRIKECRPLSKTKKFVIIEKLQ